MLPGLPPLPRLPESEVILEEVFCICNRPFQGFMVTCDSCGDLFHGVCVGLTPSLAAKRGKFTCKQCSDSSHPRQRRRGISAPNSDSKANPTFVEDLRAKVRTSLTESLGESAESARAAVAIEAALNNATPAVNKFYRARARSLITNLGDARNGALRQKILTGALSAADLIDMSVDDIAPPEVAEFKRRRQQELMQAIVLPAEAFERVQSQPWDLNHHYMNSLEHRSLALTASSDAAEAALRDNLAAEGTSAERQDSFAMPEATSSFGADVAKVERLTSLRDIEHQVDADAAKSGSQDEAGNDKVAKCNARAAALASVPMDDLNLQILPKVGDLRDIDLSLVPAAPAAVSTIAPVAWHFTVECPGMPTFAASAALVCGPSISALELPPSLYLSGRSALASLLKYAVALEHSTSRMRSIYLISPATEADAPRLSGLIEDLLKRDRGAACRVPDGGLLREAFVLPISQLKPAPSLFGGPPPRDGDLLLLIAVRNKT